MQTAIGTTTRCPGCCSPASPSEAHCRGCGLWLDGPQVAELRWIDGEIRKVDEARTWLISRRAVLLDQLIANRRRSAWPMAFMAGSAAGAAAAAAAADRARTARPEVPAATADRPAEAPARRPARPPEVSL